MNVMLEVVVIAAAVLGQAPEASLRCDGRLIANGLTRLSLEQRCGAPLHVSQIPRRVEADNVAADGLTAEVSEIVELWTYLPARGQAARLVELRRGVVTSIRALERLNETDARACQRGVYPLASLTGAIRLSCGAPNQVDRWSETREGVRSRELVTFERWVYDLGPGRFVRVLTFENGFLTAIEPRERRR